MRSTGFGRSIGWAPEHSIGSGPVRSTGSAAPMGSTRSATAHPIASSPPAAPHSIGAPAHSIVAVVAAADSTVAVAAVADCADRRCRSSGTTGTALDPRRRGTGPPVADRTPHMPLRRTHKSIAMRERRG